MPHMPPLASSFPMHEEPFYSFIIGIAYRTCVKFKLGKNKNLPFYMHLCGFCQFEL
jgi:hypothetical protein